MQVWKRTYVLLVAHGMKQYLLYRLTVKKYFFCHFMLRQIHIFIRLEGINFLTFYPSNFLAKKAAFFKMQPVLELVSTLCNKAHPKMLMEDARLRARVARQLKGIFSCMLFLSSLDIYFCY